MSNQAITWAISQRTGRSVIKFLLMAIANYCDDEGKCWPRQQTLADDTEMSLDSVQRHLKELERLGMLYRTPRRYDGGQRAPDYLILLMNDEARKLASVHGWSPRKPGEDVPSDEVEDQENDPGEPVDKETIAADCGYGISENHSRNQPEPKPHCCGSDIDEPSKNHNNPLPPSNRGSAEEGSTDERAETKVRPSSPMARSWEDDVAEFESLWPFERDEPREPCRRSMRATPPDLRLKIIDAAKRYLADVKARGAKRCSAKRFLRDKVWEGFANGSKPKTTGDRVFVRFGSDAWNAWAATRAKSWPVTDYRGQDGRLQRGWWFPTLFPSEAARDGPKAA